MGRYATPIKRDRLLRPREVAELAGVDRHAVYRYRRADVEAFLASP